MTWVLILHFAFGGSAHSTTSVPGFTSESACNAFAEQTKRTHEQRDSVMHPYAVVTDWYCVPAGVR